MLVFEDEVPLRDFVVGRLDEENPELLHLEEALAQVGEESVLDLIEDELVLLGRAVEAQHRASVVVLLPKHVVSGESSCLLVPKPLGE